MSLSAPPPFHASQLRSLASLVEAEIERQIMAGEIQAGQRVNELALARRLGVSRGPVREALQGLRRAGLVEIVANRGAIVRCPAPTEVFDLFELRGALFAVMAERVAGTRSADLIRELEENVAASELALKEGDGDTYYALNLAFHELVVEASGMRRAAAAYRDAVKELHLIRRQGLLSSLAEMRTSLSEHRSIVSALKRRDAAKAFAAARAHIKSGQERFSRLIASPERERQRA